ncbi:hypothetical protein TRFO_20455 [Tritrichomonas foetus]|uniref:Uncharacterized protein n=1 Tax=Tritrichomonas foetus TaxID=1144522 RepID=A0A1J4KH83_9EUKA|nr:hypothetical protein TRFO_20455 [Tritrichomonas foetus]|eukprot:OHT10320.1 hypothetical protein TRFO_20455 [Tritrichomonas foetus]
MFLFFSICAVITKPPIVRYSAPIQLKNKYSKNRLCVTVENNAVTYEPPTIFSSRPPFDDGWTWIVEPDVDNIHLARSPVKCGANISLQNPISRYYVSTRIGLNGVEVVPTAHVQGDLSVWTVICDEGENWIRDRSVQLKNPANDCFLTTSLAARTKELVNRFNVTCEPLSANGVWRAVEGVYFLEDDEKKADDEFDFDKKEEL